MIHKSPEILHEENQRAMEAMERFREHSHGGTATLKGFGPLMFNFQDGYKITVTKNTGEVIFIGAAGVTRMRGTIAVVNVWEADLVIYPVLKMKGGA